MKSPRTLVLPPVSLLIFLVLLAMTHGSPALGQQAKPATPEWSFNATIIEACSCSMFCPCYFSTTPSPEHGGHGGGKHYCQFNMGYKVNRGIYGTVKLDGIKFWIAGDLGDDFGDNQTEWAEVTFEPSVAKEQRDAVAAILLGPGHIYPWKWSSFTVGKDAAVEWKATKERAEARLDGGKAAEIVLAHNSTAMSGDQTVISNLKYFGAARNDGFILMPSQIEAYRVGPKPFEYKGTNGFMITIDMTSKDVH
jgi:hypothetical protein